MDDLPDNLRQKLPIKAANLGAMVLNCEMGAIDRKEFASRHIGGWPHVDAGE